MRNKIYLFLSIIILSVSCSTPKKMVEKSPKISSLADSVQRKFDYYFFEGIRLKNDQKFDQALETFRMCLSIDSLDAGIQSETGILYAALGFNNEAVKCFEKAIQFDPGNWWYNVQLISMYADLKNWKRSIEITKELQKYFPDKEQVYSMLASFYKETKEYDKAILAFEKLESLQGVDQATSIEKYNLYILLKKENKANAEIDKLVNKYPTESRYKVVRGDIFMQQKMPEKAFEIYQQVLNDDPQNAFVYVSLSEYYQSAN